MRIDHLELKNFKGFKLREFPFHPNFNLIVGDNAAGKSTLLDGLAVAAGAWFKGIGPEESRNIYPDEVRVEYFEQSGNWERQFPCEVTAVGNLDGKNVTWRREQITASAADDQASFPLIVHAQAYAKDVRNNKQVSLPLLAHYRTARLQQVPADAAELSAMLLDKGNLSRFAGYRRSMGATPQVKDMLAWIVRQSLISFQKGGEGSEIFRSVTKSLVDCIPAAKELHFDAHSSDIVLVMKDGARQPFGNLSDGQRTMLAMIGDLAQKVATLNPHLGSEALRETNGIVLIDELDLHLHPKWQRHVIEDLKKTFPKVQFFCTTHSPFLIQSLRSGEELINLDGQPPATLADMPLDDIARGIQGIEHPEVSERYAELKDVSRRYLGSLEKLSLKGLLPAAELEMYKAQLAESIAPYADNPALQAFLEMKRIATLGS